MAGLTYQGLAEDARVSRIKTPKGYDSQPAFLEEMRQRYDGAKSFNQFNQDAGEEDASFTAGNQWDPVVEQRRKALRKPVLTFNRLVAFMAQIVGNRLMNETEIRVWPDKAGTKEIAEIREAIIRSIYKNSGADFARDEALKYQVVGGQGAFCLSIDYCRDDVFEQEIKIKHVANPYAATWDPLSTEPSGGDAEYAWVEDDMARGDFKKRWPWAAETSFADNNRGNPNGYWLGDETVRVVSYWRMVTEGYRTLALFDDGTTHDVTGKEEYEYLQFVALREDGEPYLRDVPNRFARMYICSGQQILEGPFDYPVSSIPVYRVPGWEINDGKTISRWGLIRFLKDPQRLDNYWASMMAEQFVSAPRNKWLTTPEAIKGHEARWRRSPTSDDPFLFFNDGEQAPISVPPPPLDAALITERQRLVQDLREISNIHEANLGMQSNEVSGKALQQRQQISDVGSFIYHDRLRLADERCARNINELIPYIYDTERTIVITGRDNKPVMQKLNDPMDPNTDVTLGKYGVTVTVGPATVTKRQLATEQMMAFVNAVPGSAEKVMDLIADAQDWPKADEFARRFRMMLPPGAIPMDEMSDEEKAQMEQNQAAQQQAQQLEEAMAHATLADKNAQASEREARANLALANAYKAQMDAVSRRLDVDSKNEDRDASQVLAAHDQHNDMLEGDRQFVATLAEQRQRREDEAQRFQQEQAGSEPEENGEQNDTE